MNTLRLALLSASSLLLAACGDTALLTVAEGTGPHPRWVAPNPTLIPTVNIAPARGWPEGVTPQAAEGTRVAAFARGLDHPRWLLVLPNGDVLVAETNAPARPDDSTGLKGAVARLVMKRAGAAAPSANRITLLRDSQGRGVADERHAFLSGLNAPFGMVLLGQHLYVANTDAVLRFPYTPGQTQISAPGELVARLPAGPINHHWTKNLLASADGRKLYVTVGSNSNVAENGMAAEDGRAAIWELDLASGTQRVFASGLRNPNGMAWASDGVLWTVVNERDEIGSALVPDYALGPHTASLGLAAAEGNRLPGRFAQGMFIGQHGSWNRRPHSGYQVIFVPFDGARPSGAPPLPVLTGFLDGEGGAYGRPVGVAIDRQGALLVADDVGNVVWRVSASDHPATHR